MSHRGDATRARPALPRPDKPRSVLITGLPTHVARRLLLMMVENEPESRFHVVIPEHLVERLHGRLESPLPQRVEILTGDTVAMDLGLSGDEYVRLCDEVTDVYHLASIFYLGIDYEEARAVNVRGTLNVLQAASEMKRLERFNHFSTAFVAGNRNGVIMEDELESGQSFRNPFEQTKFEGEQVVARWRDRLPITVYRPSLIVGDSVSGELDRDRMDGPYMLMKAMLGAPAEVPLPLPGKGDKPLNLVPVDWVCESLYTLSLMDEARGATFHLTDPNPLPARKVFELVAQAAGRAAPRGRLPYRAARALLKLPGIERVFRRHRQFLDDFNQLTLFNSIETTRLLGARTCPPLPDYIERLVEYVLEHRDEPPRKRVNRA